VCINVGQGLQRIAAAASQVSLSSAPVSGRFVEAQTGLCAQSSRQQPNAAIKQPPEPPSNCSAGLGFVSPAFNSAVAAVGNL
jgi:hypothetical protein